MPVKMTGAQYKAFLDSNWGPDAMWEEAEIAINGERLGDDYYDDERGLMADTDIITITGGTIFPDQNNTSKTVAAEPFARKWLKAQSTVTLLVDVPREHADRFAKMIAEIGIDQSRPKVTRVGV